MIPERVYLAGECPACVGRGTNDSANCRECQRRWRKARLCVEHFHDFLGWLTVLMLEGAFWDRSVSRVRLIVLYRENAPLHDVWPDVWPAMRYAVRKLR